MASGSTPIYQLPYPLPTDPVNVAGDVQSLAGRIEYLLPILTQPNTSLAVKNGSASAINVGDPVYVSGTSASGDIEVSKSDASIGSTIPAIGIAKTSMGAGTSGEVIISGLLPADLNTSAYTLGQMLYVAVGGGLTGTAPIYPNLAQQIAMVVVDDASFGKIMMLAGGGGGQSGPITWGQLKSGL